MAIYPALTHARVLLQKLAQQANTGPAHHFLFIRGQVTKERDDTDTELPFRQESNFAWLSGCHEPGSALTVSYIDDGAGFDARKVVSKLYLPAVDPDAVMWAGMPISAKAMAEKTEVSEVHVGWELEDLARDFGPHVSRLPKYVHTLPGTTGPKSVIATINGPVYTSRFLLAALHECRRNKDAAEVALMKQAAAITLTAHEELLKGLGAGTVKDENEAEALFVSTCRKRGAKYMAYSPIVASGTSASTLHYIANSAPFPKEPTLLLVDAACEVDCYASDITRCYPLGNGGKFTKECKEIYELVLEMQDVALAMIKPGANWESIQLKMHEVVTEGLLKLGIFVAAGEKDPVKAIIDAGVSTAVFPHGVGHLLGLDTHDVGGLPEGKSTNPLLRYLRLRVPLEEGFVVTVEPGCYFNEFLLAPHKGSKFIDEAKLKQYEYVGGVRIEDNVLVTADGYDNFTSVPKTVADVEALASAAAQAAGGK